MSGSTVQVTPATSAQEANRPNNGGGEPRVLLPLVNGAVSEHTIETARTTALGNDAQLLVLNTVSVPEQTPLELPDSTLAEYRSETAKIVETIRERGSSVPVTGCIHVGHGVSSTVADAVNTYDVRITVCDDSWKRSHLSPITRTPLTKFRAHTDCSIAVPTGTSLPETVNSILVPIAGGPHSTVAMEIASSIARAYDAWIELFHVITTDGQTSREEAAQYLSSCENSLTDTSSVDTWVLEAETVAEAIIKQSQYYDLTITGAPQTPRLRRFLFGSTAKTVQKDVSSSLITVWR